jgi:ketosteroid isomerase-like protein
MTNVLEEVSVGRSAELTRQYMDAFNNRDIEALIALVNDPVEFVRPRLAPIHTRDGVRARYTADWKRRPHSSVHPIRVHEIGPTIIAEVVLRGSSSSEPEVPGLVIHEWNDDGLLVRYRFFSDRTDTPRPEHPTST